MIYTDVYVPSVDKTYNFRLNEEVLIGDIISEIADMIERYEQNHYVGDRSKICIFDKEKRIPLCRENTLDDYDIKSGAQLILA